METKPGTVRGGLCTAQATRHRAPPPGTEPLPAQLSPRVPGVGALRSPPVPPSLPAGTRGQGRERCARSWQAAWSPVLLGHPPRIPSLSAWAGCPKPFGCWGRRRAALFAPTPFPAGGGGCRDPPLCRRPALRGLRVFRHHLWGWSWPPEAGESPCPALGRGEPPHRQRLPAPGSPHPALPAPGGRVLGVQSIVRASPFSRRLPPPSPPAAVLQEEIQQLKSKLEKVEKERNELRLNSDRLESRVGASRPRVGAARPQTPVPAPRHVPAAPRSRS